MKYPIKTELYNKELGISYTVEDFYSTYYTVIHTGKDGKRQRLSYVSEDTLINAERKHGFTVNPYIQINQHLPEELFHV